MEDLGFCTMQELQKELQEKYKDRWVRLQPGKGRDSLLWMMAETGEIAQVIKKQGDERIMEDAEVRKHFIEEMCDTLMYFNDLMICYDITPEELRTVYLDKHDRNMRRW